MKNKINLRHSCGISIFKRFYIFSTIEFQRWHVLGFVGLALVFGITLSKQNVPYRTLLWNRHINDSFSHEHIVYYKHTDINEFFLFSVFGMGRSWQRPSGCRWVNLWILIDSKITHSLCCLHSFLLTKRILSHHSTYL